jgi:hypothetical protein
MRTIIIVLAICMSLNSVAQDKKERIKALKVAFLTEKLSLTEKEAQQFWPIYNAYDDTTNKIKFEDIRNIRHEIKDNINTLSDKRANELLDELTKAENRLHQEDLALTIKLQKIISSKKILLLKVAEEDFNKKLFELFKKMRQEQKK